MGDNIFSDTSVATTAADELNRFYGMVNQRGALSIISRRDHCQRFSTLQIAGMPGAGFEPAENLSLGFVEWSCALMITTTPLCRR